MLHCFNILWILMRDWCLLKLWQWRPRRWRWPCERPYRGCRGRCCSCTSSCRSCRRSRAPRRCWNNRSWCQLKLKLNNFELKFKLDQNWLYLVNYKRFLWAFPYKQFTRTNKLKILNWNCLKFKESKISLIKYISLKG